MTAEQAAQLAQTIAQAGLTAHTARHPGTDRYYLVVRSAGGFQQLIGDPEAWQRHQHIQRAMNPQTSSSTGGSHNGS